MTAQKAQCTPLEKIRVLQRRLYRAAKAQPQRTFGVLFDKVCSLDVLWTAWEQVRRNRGAAGVDGETIETIEARGALEFFMELQKGYSNDTGPTGAPCIHSQTRWAAKAAGYTRSEGSSRTSGGEDCDRTVV